MNKLIQTLALVAVVLSMGAWADPSKPRVMVILDSSRSMKELPKYINPGDIDVLIPIAVVQDGGLQGDYEPGPVTDGGVSDNECANKFCTAKKVINRVIPQYTTEARIGLTPYYQYVVNAERNGTLGSSCKYDIFSPPDLEQSFTTTVDHLSNGPTYCASADLSLCPANTRAHVFPGWLSSTCDNPAGYVAPVGNEGGSCTPGAANCYEVFKTSGGVPTTTDCFIGTWPVVSPIAYVGNAGNGRSHCLATNWDTKTFRSTIDPPTLIEHIRKYVSTGTMTCGTAQTPSTSPTTSGVATEEITSSPSSVFPSATTPTTSGFYLNPGSLLCSNTTKCRVFLSDPTPVTVAAARHWYGFHNTTFTPSAAFTPTLPARLGPNYPFSNSTGGSSYVATVLSGTVQINKYNGSGVEQFCPASGRWQTGTLTGNFGIGAPKTTLDANATVKPTVAGSVDETPDRSGTGYTCSPNWPCDATLGTPWDTLGTWVPSGNVYAATPLAPNQRVTVTTQDTFSLRVTDGTTSCPAATSVTTSGGAPANTAWISAPTGCTGTGLYSCTFTAGAALTDATAPMGTCTSPLTISDGTSAGICAWNGKTYAAGTPTTANVTLEMPFGSTCGGGTTIGSQGSYSAGCGNYPCTLTSASPLQTVGSVETSAWVKNGDTAPMGYSGAWTSVSNNGGQTQSPQSSSTTGTCAGADGTTVTLSSTTLCNGQSSCKATVVGYQQVAPSGCGSENGPCYACVYQPKQYQWSRNKVLCNYTATNVPWTVNRTAKRCEIKRNRWALETRTNDLVNCPYTVGARRYDFTEKSQTYCDYFAVKTKMQATTQTFTYKYKTKGTELIGRGSKSVTGSHLCAGGYGTAVSPSALADVGACPETIADCSGVGMYSTNFASVPLGSSCRIANGGVHTNQTQVGSHNTGRWNNFKANNVNLATVANPRTCEAAATSWSWPSTTTTFASTPSWCTDTGLPAVMSRFLVSDWYDPSTSNPATAFSTLFPSPTYTVTTNNTATKAQGFGAHIGSATMGTGALPNASLFVPIPSDSTYDAVAQRDAIRAAVKPCIMPGVVAPGPDGRLAGGVCVSDYENPTAPDTDATCQTSGCANGLGQCCSNNPGKSCTENRECWPWQDFTPLYGSLKSTHEYLMDRWTNDDDDQQCRDYFIVLATDGKESTPKGYAAVGGNAATDVEGLVASFRDFTTGTRTRPDVKTFVIAFGENIGNLDQIAAAGGTNQAYAATSLSELETALQAVFTSITQGTFSRSRPALGTDGKRLYSAQFIRPSSGPDWRGLLTAYRVAVDGTFTPAWEHGAKLDHSSHPARDIKVGLEKKSDGARVVGNFDTSNSELVDQLDDRDDFPWWQSSADVIDFLRSNTETYWGGSAPRVSKLGPILASAPVVVAKSPYDLAWGGSGSDDQAEYSNFVTATASRGTQVYFQANDGMLHAVSEGSTDTACTTLGESDVTCPNGREAWSFIPGTLELGYRPWHGRPSLVESLFRLPQGSWADLMLDNTVSIADVCGEGSDQHAEDCEQGDWKTIAIGTQRSGGRSVYALNITDNASPSTNDFLWEFSDGDLGFTYSVPVIGRVRKDGHDLFISVMGGGLDDPNTSSFFGDVEGHSVWVLGALKGDEIKEFKRFDRGPGDADIDADILARPAMFRRPGSSYMASLFVPAGAALYTMRFADPSGDQHGDEDDWKPDEFFDPTSSRNTENANDLSATTKVKRVVVTTAATTTTVATFGLTDVQDLPLAASDAPPIFNRPKVAGVLVPSGTVPDLFVGTGDVVDPANPRIEFRNGNYFYAVHDFNQQAHGAHNDGRALWVVKFLGNEQVVSEPAIISGCVIVATFTPPPVSSACSVEGTTKLYGFHPTTGELTNCLESPPGTSTAGQSTSVVELTGVGIPSDLVVVNDSVFMSTSVGGLQRAPVRQVPQGGGVRSYRRIK